MVDFHDPKMPMFVGCIAPVGYVHDAQCLMYAGPDTTYSGKEICFTYDGQNSSFSVVDVSNTSAPKVLATE